jgi:hypothetical protein
MKKILSAVIATLVAMSFTAVVFAADAGKTAEPGATSTIGEAQKDVKAAKAEEKAVKAKAKADAKEAKAKKKSDAKEAKAKAKADAKAAKAKAEADAKAAKEAAPAAK